MTDREIKRLENRISHWEEQLAKQREHVNTLTDKKIKACKTERQVAYWEEYRKTMLDRIAFRESSVVEPMREQYRNVLGMD